MRRASQRLKGAGWQSGQAHLSNACLTVSTSASGGTRRGPRPSRSQALTCLKTEPSRKPEWPLRADLARRVLTTCPGDSRAFTLNYSAQNTCAVTV